MTSSIKNLSLSFLFILFSASVLFAQNDKISNSQPKTIPGSFNVQGNLSEDDLSFYTKSIEAADFEQYRLKDAAVELKFKNGFVLELLSAKDVTIKNKNQTINPNTYPERISMPANFNYPLFEITKTGWVTAEVQSTVDKKEIKK